MRVSTFPAANVVKVAFSILLTYTCPVPAGWVFCCLLIVHPFMIHHMFDFVNLCSISCHCLLWTFIIIDSQLFSPSFRTYAFVYSCTDCCRSRLFFFERVSLPAAASALLLSSVIFYCLSASAVSDVSLL